MCCEKQDNLIKFVEHYMTAPLAVYQKQTIKIAICNKCEVRGCRFRLANKSSFDSLIIPRNNHKAYRIVMDYAEAMMRVAPDNVLK